MAASATVGEKTATGTKVEVTIENVNHALDGKWVQVTLKAKINKDAYNDVAKKLVSGDVASAQADINWAKIVENTPVLGGDQEYSGLVNKASYKIYVGENGSSDYESNEVTVKPDTTKLKVAKTWQDGTATWPEDVTNITVGLFSKKGSEVTAVKGTISTDTADKGLFTAGGNTQATYLLTKDETSVNIVGLPKLEGVTYFAQELKIDNNPVTNGQKYGLVTISDIVKFIVSMLSSGNDANGYETTVNNEKVEVEKYANNNVHADIEQFDKVFKYDIMTYVPKGSTELAISDTLVDALEFAKSTNGDLNAKAEATTEASETIASVVVKDSNDHRVNGTVAAGGDAVEPTSVSLDGKTLKVAFVGADDPANAGMKLPLDFGGKWVQVTFYAKYTDAAIQAAQVANSETVANNGTVISEITSHDGTANTASYEIFVNNQSKYTSTSNTVTHDAETTQVEVSKRWIAGSEAVSWPEGATVEVMVLGKNGAVVASDTLTADKQSVIFTGLPKLIGVTYAVAEGVVTNADSYDDIVQVEEVSAGVFEITNTYTSEQPGLEKYVNNDVHADLVEFDRIIKYDILAYVTTDAKTVTITDTLVPSLEFANGTQGVDAGAVKSTDPNAVVTAIQAKETNDHKANSTVATAGTDVSNAATVELLAEGRTLQVSFADAEAAGIRGKWVQVTFWAKYIDAIIKAAAIGDTATITDNGAVVSEIAEHDGTTNQGSYRIVADNGYRYGEDTNVVTVKPETITLNASKKWLDPAGAEMTTWPTDVQSVVINVMNGTTVADTIVLTAAQPSGTSKELPKLVGVTYTLEEGAINFVSQPREGEGYSLVRVDDGNVFVNQKSELTDIQITKVWAGARLDEVMSTDEFKKALRLTCGDTDVTTLYADKFTVVDNGNFTYTAAWSDLPVGKGEYVVEELPVAGYTSTFDGLTLTNTKVREEKPEIEKFVNQAVHKDITIDEAFTYDVVAYVTPDADTVTITDTLNDTLTFAGAAADVAVVDLGEANNHKVTFDVAATQVNGDATVAAQAQAVDGAQVSIEGKTLTVSIANKLEQVTDEAGKVVGAKNAADEQYVTPLRGHWVRVTFTARLIARRSSS